LESDDLAIYIHGNGWDLQYVDGKSYVHPNEYTFTQNWAIPSQDLVAISSIGKGKISHQISPIKK